MHSIIRQTTMHPNKKDNQSQQSEDIVRAYFEARPGWMVTKLDTGKNQAADFRICDGVDCFLVEVKTIASVHANYPYNPLVYHTEQKQKRQAEIAKWLSENPDRHIVLPPGEWEYIRGDEAEFTKRYRHQSRHTEEAFKRFKDKMTAYFESSTVKDLPYRIRLDSDDLYVPNRAETEKFLSWLEGEVQQIYVGKPGWRWHVDRTPGTQTTLYSTFYPIHESTQENDPRVTYQINIEGPINQEQLELSIFSYGNLNLDAISSNVEKAVAQLHASVSREPDHQIPQVIILAFEGGLGFEWKELSSHITWLFDQHPDLSAIAVIDRAPVGTPPPQEDGFAAWFNYLQSATWKERFVVFHNERLQHVKPLPRSVFDDHLSVQLP